MSPLVAIFIGSSVLLFFIFGYIELRSIYNERFEIRRKELEEIAKLKVENKIQTNEFIQIQPQSPEETIETQLNDDTNKTIKLAEDITKIWGQEENTKTKKNQDNNKTNIKKTRGR